ncbi:hypothetical protein [Roseicella aerolata]|uniref:Uncharacterized protein n=1 Tax=Roseicella aerolata TaxID=2883479 RepID=A0A9X1LDR0_9PROT|nr:hypothetical protein [Roseicella aerolata]MCB4825473.1 hypothetical protein [Roseicella aerolata]
MKRRNCRGSRRLDGIGDNEQSGAPALNRDEHDPRTFRAPSLALFPNLTVSLASWPYTLFLQAAGAAREEVDKADGEAAANAGD